MEKISYGETRSVQTYVELEISVLNLLIWHSGRKIGSVVLPVVLRHPSVIQHRGGRVSNSTKDSLTTQHTNQTL